MNFYLLIDIDQFYLIRYLDIYDTYNYHSEEIYSLMIKKRSYEIIIVPQTIYNLPNINTLYIESFPIIDHTFKYYMRFEVYLYSD